jgi:FMN phosphatase YigB (HAD superfamily)
MPLPAPGVTFDLWHTLIYLEPEDEERYMRSQVDAAVEVLAASDHLPGAPPMAEVGLRAAFEQEYAAAVSASVDGRSVPPAEQLARAAQAVGRRSRPEAYLDRLAGLVRRTPFRIAPEAIPVLKALRESQYALGVISNTVGEPGRFLRPILHRMGLDEFVQAYVFSDEHPWTKPAPELFQLLLREIGSEASVAVHVGDGWSDIEGARRAGMAGGVLFTGLQRYGERYRELFLPPDWHLPDGEYRAQTLREVVPIIHRLVDPGAGGRSPFRS